MKEDIIWVGVRFDPDHPVPNDMKRIKAAHDIITRYISDIERQEGVVLYHEQYENKGSACHIAGWVVICRAPDGKRVGFGRLVNDQAEGEAILPVVEQRLKQLGVEGCSVAVFTWSPDNPDRLPAALV